MPHYRTLFAYTPEAWHALAQEPVDRSAPIGALAQQLGARLVSLYYMWGAWDGAVVVEAPDDATASAFVIAAFGVGHLRATSTTRLFTAAEMVAILRQAGGVRLQPPPTPSPRDYPWEALPLTTEE